MKPARTKKESDRVPSRSCVKPEVLILASRFDLTCDYVVAQLRRRGVPYFRLNSEDFEQFAIVAVPNVPEVYIEAGDSTVQLNSEILKAIYFRRAVYLQGPFTDKHSIHEQLNRSHRSAFMRSFMVFDSCKWINHPTATYKAEHKAVQLSVAHTLGFDIPRTVITNDAKGILQAASGDRRVAVKGLETVLVWQGNSETFGYTSLIDTAFAKNSHLSSAPLIAQEALENKLDLRVTVVGDQVFCASVTAGGNPIRGDWRLEKTNAVFRPFDLPHDISEKCVRLTKSLGLVFGAIDLAVQEDTYFFLEINPTGEWGWLVDQANLPIDRAIANSLLDSK